VVRILLTGMSGAGKSTLLAELTRRGHQTVETDLDGWTDGNGGPWDEERMTVLLAGHPDVIVCGTAENQGRFRERFDQVVLLSAPIDVLIDRVRARTDNPYGRTSAQQDEIRRYVRDVEPALRRMATLELDGRRPVSELADTVDALT
jgi:shikimate kinase